LLELEGRIHATTFILPFFLSCFLKKRTHMWPLKSASFCFIAFYATRHVHGEDNNIVIQQQLRYLQNNGSNFTLSLQIESLDRSDSAADFQTKSLFKYDIYRLNSKIRMDKADLSGTSEISDYSWCLNCQFENRITNITHFATTSITPVYFEEPDKSPYREDILVNRLFRPYSQGFFGSKMTNEFESTFQFISNSKFVRKESVDGIECRLFEYKSPTQVTLSYWFESNANSRLLKFQVVPHQKQSVASFTTIMKYDNSIESKQFPSLIQTIQEKSNGKARKELIKIKNCTFNSTDPKVFELNNLPIREGQPLALPQYKEIKDYPLWRNGGPDLKFTVEDATREVMVIDAEKIERKSKSHLNPSRWPYLAIGAGLLLAGLLVLRARGRR
jgi:hypothetical protein